MKPRSALVGALGALLVLGACGGEGDGDSSGLQGQVRDDPLVVADVTMPDVTDDQAPTEFAFRADPGELMVVYFGYTNCPDLCPTTMTAVKQATARLDPEDQEKINVAMVTVDPDRDTPQKLSDFLSSFTPRYVALRTEDPDQLQTAEDAFLASSTVTTKPDGTVEVSHTASAYVVDDQGVVRVEWLFPSTPDLMANDLQYLLKNYERSSA